MNMPQKVIMAMIAGHLGTSLLVPVMSENRRSAGMEQRRREVDATGMKYPVIQLPKQTTAARPMIKGTVTPAISLSTCISGALNLIIVAKVVNNFVTLRGYG
jgi:hypothetical protein